MRQGLLTLLLFLMMAGTAMADPAPQLGFGDAVASFNAGDNQMAARILYPLANKGDARAQYYLAYLLDTGQGVGRDVYGAFGWYKKSAEQDYLPAIVYLAYVYSTGHGVQASDKDAFRWYTRGAQMGDAIAQNNLATMLRAGRPYAPDLNLASQWFLQSAMQNNARAQYNLATMYRTGEGIKKNYAEALRWYGYAANQGDAYAQNALAFMYRAGEGVPKNDTVALDWYRRAAEQGHVLSQYALGRMYENKEGDPSKGPADAAIWYFHAAKKGFAKAQYRLGVLYEQGKGLPADDHEAYKWYKQAAENDEAYLPAYAAIGQMYERGIAGKEPNFDKALEWYEKAADLNDGASQIQLSKIHMTAVKKDLVKAYQWAVIAATSTDEAVKADAIVLRIKLANMLDAAQLATARSAVSMWHPADPNAGKGPAAQKQNSFVYE